MRVSGRGFAEILSHEAIVTRRYKDSVGVWTFGVGHTARAGDPDPKTIISDQPVPDILRLFRRDLKKYEDGVNRAVKVELAQHEFDALVSFHFNTGAIGKASFVKKLNAGDRAGAAAGMMQWKKPPEIIGRRTAEMKLFRDGIYSGDGKVNVYPASDGGAVQWKKGRRVPIAELLAGLSPSPPAPPAPPRPPEDAGAAAAAAREYKQRVMAVQSALEAFGYPPGAIDGDIGTLTTSALAAYRFDRNLPMAKGIDDLLEADILKARAESWKRPISDERANKPEAEIAEKSSTMKVSWWGRILAALGIGGGAAGNAVEEALNPDQLETRLSFAQRLLHFAADNAILLIGLLLAAIGVFVAFRLIDRFKVRDYREGRRA